MSVQTTARGHRGKQGAPFADRHFKYIVIAPAILVLLLVGLFPLIYSLVVSFQGLTMLDQDFSFQGLVHYAALFRDSRLWESLLHTLIFTAVALPIELVLGLLLAYLFLEKMPGRQIFIALLTLPVVISPIVSGATWRLLFDNRFGPINQIIGWFAGEPVPIIWIINPVTVYPAILICEIWQWTPFMFLLLLAGLLSLPREPFLAAAIDGAGPVRTFFNVTWPMLLPVSAGALIIRLIEASKMLETIYVLTSGGPGTATETSGYYIYIRGLRDFEISYGAALSITYLVVMIVALTIIAKLLVRAVKGKAA